jgi:hypothetical protein
MSIHTNTYIIRSWSVCKAWINPLNRMRGPILPMRAVNQCTWDQQIGLWWHVMAPGYRQPHIPKVTSLRRPAACLPLNTEWFPCLRRVNTGKYIYIQIKYMTIHHNTCKYKPIRVFVLSLSHFFGYDIVIHTNSNPYIRIQAQYIHIHAYTDQYKTSTQHISGLRVSLWLTYDGMSWWK